MKTKNSQLKKKLKERVKILREIKKGCSKNNIEKLRILFGVGD